jgi:hypothetical protein
MMIFPHHHYPGAMEWIAFVGITLTVIIRDDLPESSWMLLFFWVPGITLLMMCGVLAGLCNLTVAPEYRMPWRNIVIRPFMSWIEWVILMSCGYYLAPEQFHSTPNKEK